MFQQPYMETLLLDSSPSLIFDLDGTLLDTEPLYTKAAQHILDPFGQTYTLEHKKQVMGGDSHLSAAATIKEYKLPLTPDEFLHQREQQLLGLFPDAAEIAGAGEFLQACLARGQKLGLATSSNQRMCELKLSKKSWKNVFHARVCGDDSELGSGKPAPDIFLLCAARLGVQPADAWVFEDSANGIAAARAAGMRVVGMRSPYIFEKDLMQADLIISSFTELLTAP